MQSKIRYHHFRNLGTLAVKDKGDGYSYAAFAVLRLYRIQKLKGKLVVHDADQFCRETGRSIATRRLLELGAGAEVKYAAVLPTMAVKAIILTIRKFDRELLEIPLTDVRGIYHMNAFQKVVLENFTNLDGSTIEDFILGLTKVVPFKSKGGLKNELE